jgi:antitoxin component of MazEF toxin-antitoxin module
MMKTTVRLTPRGNSLAVTIPRDALDAAGLRRGDELLLAVRDDGVIEISHAAAGEARLEEAFEWSLGRYGRTYEDLAR